MNTIPRIGAALLAATALAGPASAQVELAWPYTTARPSAKVKKVKKPKKIKVTKKSAVALPVDYTPSRPGGAVEIPPGGPYLGPVGPLLSVCSKYWRRYPFWAQYLTSHYAMPDQATSGRPVDWTVRTWQRLDYSLNGQQASILQTSAMASQSRVTGRMEQDVTFRVLGRDVGVTRITTGSYTRSMSISYDNADVPIQTWAAQLFIPRLRLMPGVTIEFEPHLSITGYRHGEPYKVDSYWTLSAGGSVHTIGRVNCGVDSSIRTVLHFVPLLPPLHLVSMIGARTEFRLPSPVTYVYLRVGRRSYSGVSEVSTPEVSLKVDQIVELWLAVQIGPNPAEPDHWARLKLLKRGTLKTVLDKAWAPWRCGERWGG